MNNILLGNFRTQIIRWNRASNHIRGKFRAASSDEHGRRLMVQITNDGVYDNVVGGSLHLYWNSKTHKTNGLDVFTLVNEEEGLYELYYTTELLSNIGPLSCNLYFVDNEGSITSEEFMIYVFKGINIDAIQSSDSFSSLMDALSRVVSIEDSEEERKTNESARQSNEISRQSQESERQSNESQRNTAESSRAQSESLREAAENLRKSAEEARELGESSREEAELVRESNEDSRKSDELAREQTYNQLVSDSEDLLRLLDQKYEGFEDEYAPRLTQIEQRYIWFSEVEEI